MKKLMTNEEIRLATISLRLASSAFLATLALPTMAVAQVQQEIILKVTPPELDILSEGLQTQPFGKVMPLMNKLRQQVMEQQKPVAPVPPSSPEKPKE